MDGIDGAAGAGYVGGRIGFGGGGCGILFGAAVEGDVSAGECGSAGDGGRCFVPGGNGVRAGEADGAVVLRWEERAAGEDGAVQRDSGGTDAGAGRLRGLPGGRRGEDSLPVDFVAAERAVH